MGNRNYTEYFYVYQGRNSCLSFEWALKDEWKDPNFEIEISKYEDIIKVDSENSLAWLKKGELLLKRKILGSNHIILGLPGPDDWLELSYDNSIKCFDRCLEIDPYNLEALKFKASALLLNGEYTDSINLYRLLVDKNPNDPLFLNDLGVALSEFAIWKSIYSKKEEYLNEFFESIKCFEKAISLSPHIMYFNNIANIYQSQENYLVSLKYYNLALELDNHDITTLFNIALNYIDLCQYDKAKEFFRITFEIDPEATRIYFENYYEKVTIGSNVHDPTKLYKGMKVLEIGIELFPENLSIYSSCLDFIVMLNCYKEFQEKIDVNFALTCVWKLLENGSTNIDMDGLDQLLTQKKRYEELLKILGHITANELFYNSFYYPFDSLINLLAKEGYAKEIENIYEKQINPLEKIIKTHPNSKKSLIISLVIRLIKLKSFSDAEKYIEKLGELEKTNSDYIFYKGYYYLRKGELSKAISFFESIPANDSYYIIAVRGKISALIKLGSKADALTLIYSLLYEKKLDYDELEGLLNSSFELDDYELIDKVIKKAESSLNEEDFLNISKLYIKMQKYRNEKDENEKLRLKKELEDKAKIEVYFKELNKKLDNYNQNNINAHRFTHRRLNDISSLISSYGGTLAEIKNSANSIDDKVEKIQEQTFQVKEVLKKKYPKEYDEIKEELRKKLEI
ncbi:MAG: hypothetical protein HPY60_00320 [Candidatus Methanofastidiosum sp.]|nr:hypothetical protein [Methanofastidiosum sp.]